MSQPTTTLIVITLLAFPLAVWLERSEPSLWQERLFLPSFTQEENLHTPAHSKGTFLPPRISENITFTANQNPIILARSVVIPPGVTVTLEAGAHLFAHEFSQLVVEGSLATNGTQANPVKITSNEEHVANRNWNGIIFKGTGQGTFNHTTIRYGSPAITCEPQSIVKIMNTIIEQSDLGLYTESETCVLENSLIQYVTDGIISRGISPIIRESTINAKKEDIQSF